MVEGEQSVTVQRLWNPAQPTDGESQHVEHDEGMSLDEVRAHMLFLLPKRTVASLPGKSITRLRI